MSDSDVCSVNYVSHVCAPGFKLLFNARLQVFISGNLVLILSNLTQRQTRLLNGGALSLIQMSLIRHILHFLQFQSAVLEYPVIHSLCCQLFLLLSENMTTSKCEEKLLSDFY